MAAPTRCSSTDARATRAIGFAADWDAIGEIAHAVPIPVIGNGDLLFPHEIEAARQRSGCAAVMVARAALIKPWIFREALEGYCDITADERLGALPPLRGTRARALGRRTSTVSTRVRTFVRWHLDFWCRYVPRRADGTYPSMQHREEIAEVRSATRSAARSQGRSSDDVFD